MTSSLVTGGSGYLGTHVRTYFGADNASRRAGWNLLDGTTRDRIAGYPLVIHLAAVVDKSPRAWDLCRESNIEATIRLAECLTPDQTLIFASTKDVYNSTSELYAAVPEDCPTAYEAQSPYAWSKWLAEENLRFLARHRGFRLGIFRLSTVFAPATEGNPGGWVSRFAEVARRGDNLTLKNRGRQVRDVLPVDELCRAFELFARGTTRYGLFNIGGGPEYALSLADAARRLCRLSGQSEDLVILSDEPTPGEQTRYVSDTSRLRELLGWEARFDLDAALRRA